MIPNSITAAHVQAAIEFIDQNGVPESRRSTRHHVAFNGRRYPPKYVVSLAAKQAIGMELASHVFNGGHETNSFLKSRGFRIESNQAIIPSNRVLTGTASGSRPNHNERCGDCKTVVRALLEKLYGTVESQKKFPIATLPSAFGSSAHSAALCEIYAALQSHRGFNGFVRALALSEVDYFVPSQEFIVEFDESQHFTAPRRLALSRYPSMLATGFDRNRWMSLCDEINAQDDDPPDRDEQRAWYDTLRDFLPTVFSLEPTVRLYSREFDWCRLDPSRPEDVETFRQILSERAHFWSINTRGSTDARYARLAIDGAWSGDPVAARRLLGDVASMLNHGRRLTCCSTCAAFLRFEWPKALPYRGNLEPSARELDVLVTAAESAVRRVLDADLMKRLAGHSDYLTLGVDTMKNHISTAYEVIEQPHAELVCLVDLRAGTFWWTGKFNPTSGQAATIVRWPDLQSHFVRLGDDPVMILGCNDLSAYDVRGRENARGWRQQAGTGFRALAAKFQPTVVLQHPHTTTRLWTWRNKWEQLRVDLPSVQTYLGTGAYSFGDPGWNKRDPLADVLDATAGGLILDFIVELAVQRLSPV